jgi:hypothetical protein
MRFRRGKLCATGGTLERAFGNNQALFLDLFIKIFIFLGINDVDPARDDGNRTRF